jgi:hypothetical protein|tara:strand:+ start:3015 stop:3311 length:297 start_codon:yes stop_codon:yes gene_type:complete
MSEQKTELKDIISFQVHRNIVNLYKKYFEITEDLLREHQQYKNRIKKSSLDDMSIIDDLDYFTEERFNQTRKKILDAGNDATREIDKTLEFVTVSLKE